MRWPLPCALLLGSEDPCRVNPDRPHHFAPGAGSWHLDLNLGAKLRATRVSPSSSRVNSRRSPATSASSSPSIAALALISAPAERRAYQGPGGRVLLSTRGSLMRKLEPIPGSLVTVTSPSINLQNRSTIARPSPVPPYLRVVDMSA